MKNTLFTLIIAFMMALFMSSCSTYEGVSYGHSPRVTVTIGQPYSYYVNCYDYYGYGWHYDIYYWHWYLMPYYVHPSYHFNWYHTRHYRWHGYKYHWNNPHHYGNHWHGIYNPYNGVSPNPSGNNETYKARVRHSPSGTSGSMSGTRGRSTYNRLDNGGSKNNQRIYQQPSNTHNRGGNSNGYNRTTNSSRPSSTYRNRGNNGTGRTGGGRPSSSRSGNGRR